jgi:hypothetical protein
MYKVRKRVFWGRLYYKRSFYQDRLGTNIGKTQKREMNFLIVGRRSTEQDDPAGGGGAFQQQAGERDGAENRLARASCVQNRSLSTKTGSGRIQVKQGVFCSGPSRELATQTRTFGPSPAGARAGFRRFCTTRQTSSRGETVREEKKRSVSFSFLRCHFIIATTSSKSRTFAKTG